MDDIDENTTLDDQLPLSYSSLPFNRSHSSSTLSEKVEKIYNNLDLSRRRSRVSRVSIHSQQLPPENPAVDTGAVNAQLKASTDFHVSHVSLPASGIIEELTMVSLKPVCRGGLRHEHRQEVWLRTSGTRESMNFNPDLYSKTKVRVFTGGRSLQDFPDIPYFGHSPNFKYHSLSEEGEDSVTRVLLCLSYLHRDVDYCPILGDILSVAIAYMTEEEVFHLGHHMLVRSRYDEWFFPLSTTHFAIFAETFCKLVEWKLDDLYEHMSKIGAVQGMIGIVKDWFARGFVSHLPRYAFLRTMDAYFYEGSKILHRVGLGILSIHEDQLLSTKNSTEFLEELRNLSENCHDAQTLLDTSFDFSLSRKDFARLQESIRHRIDELHIPKAERPIKSWPTFHQGSSNVIQVKECLLLWTWLPNSCHLGNLYRLFTASDDGYSLSTLTRKSRQKGPVIILVRTTAGDTFGVFLSASLLFRNQSVVDRQCIVFKFGDTPVSYQWLRDEHKDIVYRCSDTRFSLFGGEQTVLSLDARLNKGTSEPSTAFDSESLSSTSDFQCSEVEVWGFDHMDQSDLTMSL